MEREDLEEYNGIKYRMELGRQSEGRKGRRNNKIKDKNEI